MAHFLTLYKGGSPVGSIGSYAGTHLRVGSGETNILFASTLGMLPATSSGTASDGLINIGFDDRRFKDLYLSGTANADVINGASSVIIASGGTSRFYANSSGFQPALDNSKT